MKFTAKNTCLLLLLAVLSGYVLLAILYLNCGAGTFPWYMDKPFADLTYIGYAAECLKNGIDPYSNPLCDPWMRRFNYPALWLHIWNALHISIQGSVFIGLACICLFALTAVYSMKGSSLQACMFMGICLFSPPVLLLLERGNTDVVVYLLAAGTVLFLRQNHYLPERLRLYLPYLVFFGLGALKLYPFVLFGLLLFENRMPRKQLWVYVFVLTGIALYLYVQSDEIRQIISDTPRPEKLAFGRRVYLLRIHDAGLKDLVSLCLFFFCCGLAFLYGRFRFRSVFLSVQKNESALQLFVAGVLLFAAAFFLGNSYIYKLVFLLLCLPQIFQWLQSGPLRPAAAVFLILLVLRLYYNALVPQLFNFRFVYLADLFLSWGLLWLSMVFLSALWVNRNASVE